MEFNDWQQFIKILDYLLLPFYLVIIYLIAYFFRESNYPPGHPWRKHFMTGLFLKIGGALFIGFIYQYYYGWGDTALYFYHADVVNSAFSESPAKWFNLLFRIPEWYEGEYAKYITRLEWYQSPTEYSVVTITALIAVFGLNSYLPTSVLLAALAYTGIWALFRTFATKYPNHVNYIAIAVLYIPSTIMWGSGIFKDTVCMFGLGWLTYGAFRLLINRDFRTKTILITVFAFYLIAMIKVYILIAFLPALVFWILATYSHKIRNGLVRLLIKVGVIAVCIFGFLFFMQQFSETLGRYSLDKFAKTSYKISSYVQEQSGDQGSAYNIGANDPTTFGMLKKFPAAVNVTLFRPYLWESRKVIQLVNALEATIFLLVTIKLILTVGLKRIWQTISRDPTIQFCLIFTLIFAFAVGISSGNFGTLSRYRIPCLPYYALSLIVIYYKNMPSELSLLSFSLPMGRKLKWIYDNI